MSPPVDSPSAAVDRRTWFAALLLSVVVHAFALALLRSAAVVQPDFPNLAPLPVTVLEPAAEAPPAPPPPRVARLEPPPAPEPPPEARIAEPEPPAPEPKAEERKEEIPLPEQQIVSPPEGGTEKPPEETRLLSDRDVTVEEESVRRGAPAPGTGEDVASSPATETTEAALPKGEPERPREQVAALPDLRRLLPNAVQLAREGYGAEAAEQEAEQEAKKADERREQRLASGSWPIPSERIGTFDFLPDVREGDITLLNTKAELFAPFVRRVAVRVFQNLLISLRRDLTGPGPSGQEMVAAEAVMSRTGELVAVQITDRSPGVSMGVDRKLRQACLDGFFDRNPPPGARSDDGNIRFMLRAQVAAFSDQRGYRLGYRVLFQAGLL